MAPTKKSQRKVEKTDTKTRKHKGEKKVGVRKEKRIHFQYTEEALAQAIEAIRSKSKGIREACRQYGVPRATVQDRISGRISEKPRKVGPEPLLGFDGECKVVDWIIDLAKCGIPVSKEQLLETVKNILKDMGKGDKLPEGKRPGQTWYQSFLRRHPEISVREPESINKARESVRESTVRKWFEELECFLIEKGLTDIMKDPERILNADETGVSLCPKTGKILAPKGYKNVYTVKKGNEKETLTVLVTMTASGKICPPLVVFPYVRPPKAVIDNMPDGWVTGKSESGWMRSDVFYEYIANDFNDWLTENNVERPVILFVDGHRSHMSMQLSTFCEDNDIILYALPPNTTHITQPADVSVFRPLKAEWKKTVSNWQSRPENHNSTVTKTNFCKVFNEALKKDMAVTIQNGFRKCGLYPFNVEAVDFTKCVKDYQEKRRGKKYSSDELTERDFISAQRVVIYIKQNLANKGIDADDVCNEIEFARNNCKEKRRSASKTPRKSTEVAKHSSLKTPEQTNVLQTSITVASSSHNIASSSFINDMSIPDIGSFISLNDISVRDFSLEHLNMTDTGKSIVEPKDICLVTESSSPTDEIFSFPSNITTIAEVHNNTKFESNHTNPQDDLELYLIKSPTQITNNVDNKTDELKENTPGNFVKSANAPIEEKVIDPFEKHLKFVDNTETKTKKKNFPKYPSAISAKKWRDYYESKEKEKRNVEDQKVKRKAEREQKRNENAVKKQKIVDVKQMKIKQTKKYRKTDEQENFICENKSNDKDNEDADIEINSATKLVIPVDTDIQYTEHIKEGFHIEKDYTNSDQKKGKSTKLQTEKESKFKKGENIPKIEKKKTDKKEVKQKTEDDKSIENINCDQNYKKHLTKKTERGEINKEEEESEEDFFIF